MWKDLQKVKTTILQTQMQELITAVTIMNTNTLQRMVDTNWIFKWSPGISLQLTCYSQEKWNFIAERFDYDPLTQWSDLTPVTVNNQCHLSPGVMQ